jgi:GH25 family lysozyme M1 (1,4-beta-N-acetylmuramidase)
MLFPDLSEFQPGADLAGIRKLTPAIIIRAAYGADHIDHCFESFRSGAHANNFQFIGIYHYLVAGQDPTVQADAFCKLLGDLKPGEIPILDIEEGAGSQVTRSSIWLSYVDHYFDLVARILDKRSWIYSYPGFISSAGLSTAFSSSRPTWVAQYDTAAPSVPHTLWQSTDGQKGVNITDWPGAGKCDTNYYNGNIQTLASLAWQPAPQEEKEVLNVQLHSGDAEFIPFPAGSFKQVIAYADFVSAAKPAKVRIAIHSASKGYAIHELTLSATKPEAISFATTDVDAVSIESNGPEQVGVTLA